VFAVREFRALWASQILSIVGDRLALVALTLLVFDRTRSPLLAAIAYAAGYVPYLIGALFLSGIADRLPRREVMIGCDAIRAVLVAAMLVPRMPVPGLVALLYATTMFAPPFEAARAAITPDYLEGDRYTLATAILQTTIRAGIVTGAAAGGVLVAFAGARAALGIDVATFVASAALVRSGIRARSAAGAASGSGSAAGAASGSGSAAGAASGSGQLARLAGGARLVFGDKALRTLVLLGWLVSLYQVPEGIAAPYAARLGGGPVAAGLLIASTQLGAVLIMPAFAKRIGPLTRLKWMGPMAVCACAVLVLTISRPGLALSMALFTLSGTFAVYQIAANSAFVARVPNERRAQAFGLANAGLVVGQGVAFMGAGAAAEAIPPSTVIAACGGLGALVACGLALRWRRMSPAVGRHSARHLRGQALLARQAPVHVARSRLKGR
jgi:hypothetical protein